MLFIGCCSLEQIVISLGAGACKGRSMQSLHARYLSFVEGRRKVSNMALYIGVLKRLKWFTLSNYFGIFGHQAFFGMHG